MDANGKIEGIGSSIVNRHLTQNMVSLVESIGQLGQPLIVSTDAQAYALPIVGNSMWPRFRPGMRIAVSARAPAASSDDVRLCDLSDVARACAHRSTRETDSERV